MKEKLLTGIACMCCFTLGFCTTGNAATTKYPYLGVQLGNSETHYNKSGFDDTTNSKDAINGTVNTSGFGSRALVGLQFNPNWAAEVGYTYFGNTNGHDLNYSDGTNNKSGTIKQEAYDISGKGIWPLAKEINVYGKLGIAYLRSKVTTNNNFSKNRNKIKPLLGAGIGFNITQHFTIDASYIRIFKSGRIQDADLISIGFYYKFC